MVEVSHRICRKLLSLTLIFNSVITIISTASILLSSYIGICDWSSFAPYLLDRSLLLFPFLASAMNLLPAKMLGKVNIKRILFHHYVYGLLVSSMPLFLTMTFAPAYTLILLIPWLGLRMGIFEIFPAYAGSFFVYGGLTLIIDDFHDISASMSRSLNKIRSFLQRFGKILRAAHLFSSLVSMYTMVCGVLWCIGGNGLLRGYFPWESSQIIFLLNLFITSILGLWTARKRIVAR